MVTLMHVSLAQEMPLVRRLFEEYAASLDIDLCFQHFDEELARLPGEYAPPEGTIIIGCLEGEPAGCVALRKWGGDSCEMKRLYVKPECRGKGVGRALAEAVIAHARNLGYASIKLDTLGSMREANELYASLGFKECKPDRYNPCTCPIFMELSLR